MWRVAKAVMRRAIRCAKAGEPSTALNIWITRISSDVRALLLLPLAKQYTPTQFWPIEQIGFPACDFALGGFVFKNRWLWPIWLFHLSIAKF